MWINVKEKLPMENVVVKTKINDSNGVRNEQDLLRRGNL